MSENNEKSSEKQVEKEAPTNKQQQHKFNFDRNFQEKIAQAMLIDRMWAAQFSEVLDVDYFQYAHLKLVVSEYVSYQKKWKEFPSMELLLTMIKNELKNDSDAALRNEIKSFFVRVETKKDLGDLGFVKEKALEFCKKAALQGALLKSVDLVETENYDKIIEVVRKAIASGTEHNEGLDLFSDIDARYSETYRRTIPTGVPELDQRTILNGGLGSGEIGFVVANSGVGKSQVLVHFGASAIKLGKNVVHYTFELNERMIGIRYDSHMLDIPSLQCYDEREKIKQFYKEKEGVYGKLIVKYFPTGQASTNTLRIHLEKLQTKGFIPDLVIVDYSGIMRSSDRNELLRLELKKVCEELRSLAEDMAVPLWTAVQSNKEGSNSDIVDLTNMAESYAQAHVADFVLGLSRQSAQKASGFGNIFVAKNRAGMDGIKYHIHLDTSRSKLKVLTDDEAANFKTDEQRDFRMGVLKRFEQLQSNKSPTVTEVQMEE